MTVTQLIESLKQMPGDMIAAVAINGEKPVPVTGAYDVVMVPYPGYVIVLGHNPKCDGKHDQSIECEN